MHLALHTWLLHGGTQPGPCACAPIAARAAHAPRRVTARAAHMQTPREWETWRGSANDGRPATLVTGATGGVGRRVAARLLARGARVRALVRDVDKARQLLMDLPAAADATLEVVAADLGQPSTLRRGAFDGVRSVVHAAAVKVQPKEGDADRSKCAHTNNAHIVLRSVELCLILELVSTGPWPPKLAHVVHCRTVSCSLLIALLRLGSCCYCCVPTKRSFTAATRKLACQHAVHAPAQCK